MPIDPSILLQTQPARLPDIGAIRAQGLQNQTAQLQLDQAQQQQQRQMMLRDLYRKNTGQDGAVNSAAMASDMAQAGLGDQIPDYQQRSATASSALSESQLHQLAVTQKKVQIVGQSLASMLSNPNVTHDDVIAHANDWVNQGLMTPDQGAQFIRQLPGPNQLRPWLVQQAMKGVEIDKQISMAMPEFKSIDTGGQVVTGTVNNMTGQFTKNGALDKTPTPGEKLTNQRFTSGGLTGDAIDLAAQRILNGEPSSRVLANFGRGQQGARDIAQVQNRLALLAAQNGLSAQDIADKSQSLAAEGKARLVAGGQEGKISTAVNELGIFGDQVLDASKNVPRGSFVPWNQLKQMADSKISDPALITFKAKMQTLNNAFDQLSARGGMNAAKMDHIRELFNTANDQEGVQALVKALKEEGMGAHQAASDAMHGKSSLDNAAATAQRLPANQGAIVPIKSDNDYNSLPSGTRFQAPDGTIRVKP